MATRHSRQRKDLSAGKFQPAITSFTLHLNAEDKSLKTVRTYVEAAQWFAAAHLLASTDYADWDEVTGDDVRRWMVWLLDTYSDSYANNQYRALQQSFKWWSDDEDLPNPMVKMSPPVVGEKVVPVFTEAELSRLLKEFQGRDFDHRRALAIMSMFKDTGMRLAELAGIRHVPDDPERNDLDLQRREVRVRGKHTYADNSRLWLGTRTEGR